MRGKKRKYDHCVDFMFLTPLFRVSGSTADLRRFNFLCLFLCKIQLTWKGRL